MTPIQEVIQWAETRDMRDYPNKYAFRQGIVTKLKQALEKEKEQMIDFGYKCRNKCKKESKLLPQDIFNTTYNQ